MAYTNPDSYKLEKIIKEIREREKKQCMETWTRSLTLYLAQTAHCGPECSAAARAISWAVYFRCLSLKFSPTPRRQVGVVELMRYIVVSRALS